MQNNFGNMLAHRFFTSKEFSWPFGVWHSWGRHTSAKSTKHALWN